VTIYETLTAALAGEQPVVLATVIRGPAPTGAKILVWPDGTVLGSLSPDVPQATVVQDALGMLARAETATRIYQIPAGELELFIESYPSPSTLYIVGAVHIAIALVSFAKVLGFRTVVIDARSAFATAERFSHADELIDAWPDEVLPSRLNQSSYVVVLTHDPKLDDPALKVALGSPARYIGALGSPRTNARRVARLEQEGIAPESIARLHAPIGLAIGARTPEEIAVSIIAEIVAARHGLTGKA